MKNFFSKPIFITLFAIAFVVGTSCGGFGDRNISSKTFKKEQIQVEYRVKEIETPKGSLYRYKYDFWIYNNSDKTKHYEAYLVKINRTGEKFDALKIQEIRIRPGDKQGYSGYFESEKYVDQTNLALVKMN